jgi:hypothetical protein
MAASSYIYSMKDILKNLDLLIEASPDDCYFNDPADDKQIAKLEKKHGISLPGSFVAFLKHYNGGFIALIEDHEKIDLDDLAWNSNYILAVELMDELIEGINFKTEGMDVKYIPFLHTSDGEYLGFRFPLDENGESAVYDLWHEAPAEDWADSVVYKSFPDLLKVYIENKGNVETM